MSCLRSDDACHRFRTGSKWTLNALLEAKLTSTSRNKHGVSLVYRMALAFRAVNDSMPTYLLGVSIFLPGVPRSLACNRFMSGLARNCSDDLPGMPATPTYADHGRPSLFSSTRKGVRSLMTSYCWNSTHSSLVSDYQLQGRSPRRTIVSVEMISSFHLRVLRAENDTDTVVAQASRV